MTLVVVVVAMVNGQCWWQGRWGIVGEVSGRWLPGDGTDGEVKSVHASDGGARCLAACFMRIEVIFVVDTTSTRVVHALAARLVPHRAHPHVASCVNVHLHDSAGCQGVPVVGEGLGLEVVEWGLSLVRVGRGLIRRAAGAPLECKVAVQVRAHGRGARIRLAGFAPIVIRRVAVFVAIRVGNGNRVHLKFVEEGGDLGNHTVLSSQRLDGVDAEGRWDPFLLQWMVVVAVDIGTRGEVVGHVGSAVGGSVVGNKV